MSPAQPITQERIYREIKAKIMSGHFGMTEKLEAPSLARFYGASVTPVREALFRLIGEGLVRTAPDGGFQIQALSRESLKEMYSLIQALLLLSLGRVDRGPKSASAISSVTDRVERMAAPDAMGGVFHTVLLLAGNRHIVDAGSRLIDRLAPVRHIEATVIGGTEAEQTKMLDLLHELDFGGLRQAVHSYHRRRIAKAAQLLTELAMQSLA